jgi:hypothetical protein
MLCCAALRYAVLCGAVLTQALQAHCVSRSVAAHRQLRANMGSLNWAINSIWVAPACDPARVETPTPRAHAWLEG